jgi:predicted RNA binding protein YcfA (HicA-like mRNA interferase family)
MNARLPTVNGKQVIRALKRAGFVVSRTSGSHCRLVHTTDPRRNVTVPMHRTDLRPGTLRSILAQAGLTVAEFIGLL